MPRRQRSGSKTYKRRTYSKKRGPTNKTLNKKIKNIENNLIELKWHDTNVPLTPIDDSGYIISNQNLVPQGDFPYNRNGGEINATSIQMTFDVISNSQAIIDRTVRCIVFWDRQCNGDVPPLAAASGTPGLPNPGLLDNQVIDHLVDSPRYYPAIHRYSVLYDKRFTIKAGMVLQWDTADPDVTNVLNQGQTIYSIRKHIKLSRKIRLTVGNPSIDHILGNAIYIAFISDTSTAEPDIRGSVRLYFRDA